MKLLLQSATAFVLFFNLANVWAQACYDESQQLIDEISYSGGYPSHAKTFIDQPRTPAIGSERLILNGLVALYEKTRDTRLLDELVTHLDIIIAHTSEVSGEEDHSRSPKSPPSWGEEDKCGSYIVYLLNAGFLSYPLAFFARSVLGNPALHDAYLTKAEDYLAAAEASLGTFTSDWQNVGSSEGYYKWPVNFGNIPDCGDDDYDVWAGNMLPYNHMLTAGRAHIQMARAYEIPGSTQDLLKAAGHYDKALKLSNFFKSELEYQSTLDAYFWKYRGDGWTDRLEDSSHGSLDVNFVLDAVTEGLFFTESDLSRIVNTYLNILADPACVLSHQDHTSCAVDDKWGRWQRGVVRAVPLSIMNNDIYDKVRDIYYNHGGGPEGGGSSNLEGLALMAKARPNEDMYPIKGEQHSSALPAFKPNNSTRPADYTGLYRSSSMGYETIDGRTVTSCVKYQFLEASDADIEVRAQHTDQTVAGDGCSGASCGTAPGLRLFIGDGTNWTFIKNLTLGAVNTYVNDVANISTNYTHAMLCRSAAGHGADNIRIRYITQARNYCMVNSCAGDFVDVSDFEGSSDGWASPSCSGYSYQLKADGLGHSGDGYLRNQELSTPDGSSCNPVSTEGLEMANYKDFLNTGDTFRVSGWTRFKSSYSGSSSVTNRCVKVLDANTLDELHSICTVYENKTDSGWIYFNYDFSGFVVGVSEVRVVVGMFDSWAGDHNQVFMMDDIKVEGYGGCE